MQHHRDAGGRHRFCPQQADGIFHRFLHHRGQVQLLHVSAVREGKARLHLRILLGDRLQHAIRDRALEARAQAATVVDLDLSAAVAVNGVAHTPDSGIEGGRPPLHVEREIDLALRIDLAQRWRGETGHGIGRLGRREHVGFVGVVVAAVEQRLLHQPVERLRLGIGCVGKADAMLKEGAQPDPTTLGRDQ